MRASLADLIKPVRKLLTRNIKSRSGKLQDIAEYVIRFTDNDLVPIGASELQKYLIKGHLVDNPQSDFLHSIPRNSSGMTKGQDLHHTAVVISDHPP